MSDKWKSDTLYITVCRPTYKIEKLKCLITIFVQKIYENLDYF